jgi:vitamin B12 transporter
LSFGYNFASDKRIPYQPLHTIGASLEVPWETGSVLVSGHYESLRFSDRANLSKLKPCFLLNVVFNQKIGKNFSVFAVMRNLLNQSYESFADYPMPGINITLGLKMVFEGIGKNTKEEEL